MPIPVNKTELLASMQDSYRKLKLDLDRVEAEDADLVELEGHAKGSLMSVSNQVAYLIGWGELVLKWHRLEATGKTIDFPETGYNWLQLGALAQKFYGDCSDLTYPELMRKLDKTFEKLIELTESHENSDLYGKGWYKQYSRGRMIQLNSSSPYKNARNRVRKWLREKA